MLPKGSPTKYTKQAKPRETRRPPHVSLRALRNAVGITLETLSERLEEITGHEYSRGTLAAIELGSRGTSAELVEALALAYGIDAAEIDTNYVPRAARPRKSAA